jgi:hypothetical protein
VKKLFRIFDCSTIGIAIVVALAVPALVYARQNALAGGENSKTTVDPAPESDVAANQIVSKLLVENERRKESLQHYTVVRTYEIRTKEGRLDAQAVVRMEYRAPDVKTFEKTSEKGSAIVRHLVFDGLMNSETETSSGKQHHDSALTPANYVFHLAREEDLGPHHCFVLDVVPKRKDKYLFEGTIWIESREFAVAKIDGHPAKKPSFWVKHVDFVRQFQNVDGFWLPLRDETQVDVKLYGKRVFTIDHREYLINADSPLRGSSGDTGGNMLVAPSATLRP